MRINRYKLDNGLRIIHTQIKSTQMVALNILYNVGSKDEHPDHTGFAHLFEHLMFGGSVHIPNYDIPLQKAGGENNAFTNNDYTNYYLTVPAQNVEIGFWLESDRMLGLRFNQRSLDVQRNVVIEEFKERHLNAPYGDVPHIIRPMAYKVHPYQWPTIGKDISHIANATLPEVRSFFYHYYAPNNAILSVTGNISFEKVIELSEKWFGSIPRRHVPRRRIIVEPEQKEERRQIVERNVPIDALYITYHMCDRKHPDYYAFDILSDILSNGTSSRLIRRLVKEQQLFTSLDCYITGSIDAGLFQISGKLAKHISLEQGEAGIRQEIESLRKDVVSPQELEKVKNKFESEHIFGQISYLNIAMNLAYFELCGKAENLLNEVARYRSVTQEQLLCVSLTAFKNPCVLYYKKES
jgi:zinc protease